MRWGDLRARSKGDEYLAARFACKEATYKAVERLVPSAEIRPWMIETTNDEAGKPEIGLEEGLWRAVQAAGVGVLHVSITTEGDFATAFVIAESAELR